MKFLLKFFCFIILLFFFQLIIGGYNSFYKLDLLKENIDKTDIFYFGSSVDWYTDKNDIDRRSISKILDSLQPTKSVYGVSDAAYHLEIFRDYFNYVIKNKKSKPELMIFEINLRSFSPEWHFRPNYQFEKERSILNDDLIARFEKPLSVLKFDQKNINSEEFFNKNVFLGNTNIGLVRDFININDSNKQNFITKKFIFHYLYKLDEFNNKIKALKDIVELAYENEINILFFVSPIDYTTGVEYLGNKFLKITTKNISFIKEKIKSKNNLIDLSYCLDSNNFTYIKVPNEHLKYTGRYFVAEEINKWCNVHVN